MNINSTNACVFYEPSLNKTIPCRIMPNICYSIDYEKCAKVSFDESFMTSFIEVEPKILDPVSTSEGYSIEISLDGLYVVSGCPNDISSSCGSSIVYIRTGAGYNSGYVENFKLIGTGYSGNSNQGSSVSISNNGSTIITGGPGDNSNNGAAWIFVNTSNYWYQQGSKLIGTGYSGLSSQGYSVSVNGSGTIAAIGAPYDNNGVGAVWVFSRTGNDWHQEQKLIGTGYSISVLTGSGQGSSLALSMVGSLLIVGSSNDQNNIGSTWVFVRTLIGGIGMWNQQQKLIGTGYSGLSLQGSSVSMDELEEVIAIGGPGDNNNNGSVWVFQNNNNNFIQTNKLVSINTGPCRQGSSVSINAEGTVIASGSPGYNNNTGAVCIFSKTSPYQWTQQNYNIIGQGYTGQSLLGQSVSMNNCMNSLVIGGPGDNNSLGAIWVFNNILYTNLTEILRYSTDTVKIIDLFPYRTLDEVLYVLSCIDFANKRMKVPNIDTFKDQELQRNYNIVLMIINNQQVLQDVYYKLCDFTSYDLLFTLLTDTDRRFILMLSTYDITTGFIPIPNPIPAQKYCMINYAIFNSYLVDNTIIYNIQNSKNLSNGYNIIVFPIPINVSLLKTNLTFLKQNNYF